ncbi:sensor histidine kinase [Flavivirga aquimarina]|uniref:Sensor histidine kinase n=1 Tax=Flavivirga aquimarina TaxID=2027862 RepID=A0ABT8W875_9FLAO|nr:sensor histidine kinase [Flavivirga aquimarina]MDO5969286.1 sensor histidine kinase [Flavivirga aquimarina]
MTIKTIDISPKKIAVNLLFLLLFTSLLININPNFPFYYDKTHRVIAYMILSGAAIFYIHNLVFLPILTLENDRKKYKRFIVFCILTYLALMLCFWTYNAKISPDSSYVFDINFQKLFTISELTKLLIISIIPLAVASLLSYAYSAIMLSKKIRMRFLEFFINMVIVVLLYLVSATMDNGFASFLLTILFVVFYANAFYITPILITEKNKRKHRKLLLILSTFYFVIMVSVFFEKISNFFRLDNLLYLTFNLFGVLCLVYLLSYVYGFYRLKLLTKEKVFIRKLDAKELELHLLKSQVNPHFLFNTLNTLYSTALEEGASKTAESTAKLANLIRYMQEDINKGFIPLEKEIKYVQDYILIQKLRCVLEPEIKTCFKNIENHHISPGLLIPFVENAFKYGINPSKISNLKISVICTQNTINFECINSYNNSFKPHYKEQGFGIGIKNAKQRLELVYPNNHTFEVKKEDNIFSIKIRITVKRL